MIIAVQDLLDEYRVGLKLIEKLIFEANQNLKFIKSPELVSQLKLSSEEYKRIRNYLKAELNIEGIGDTSRELDNTTLGKFEVKNFERTEVVKALTKDQALLIFIKKWGTCYNAPNRVKSLETLSVYERIQ